MESANFCVNCGESFKVQKRVDASAVSGSKEKPDTSKGISSYTLIVLAFIAALAVILIIYNSNRRTLAEKLAQASTQQQSVQQQQQQPSMEMMQEIEQLKERAQNNPNDFDAQVELANNYFDINRYDQAVDYYLRAIAINDQNPNVLIDLGVSYFNSNMADSALIYVNKALELEPHHVQGLYNVGIIYYNIGQVDKAIQNWEHLIEVKGNTREAQAAEQFIQQIKSRNQQS